MPTTEVICISSDDDDGNPNKINKITDEVLVASKTNLPAKELEINDSKSKNSINNTPIKAVIDSNKSHNNSRKRKLDDEASDNAEPSCSKIKEIKMIKYDDNNCLRVNEKSDFSDENQNNELITKVPISVQHDKPNLIIKEKKSVVIPNQDTFSMFISQCLRRDRTADMEKIVQKLKKHYKQLHPSYANSKRFSDFLNEKRNILTSDQRRLYTEIEEVYNEMKQMRGRVVSESDNDDYTEEVVTDPRKLEKIFKIRTAMEECRRRIKRLEEAEVDWDDENESNYLKLQKYKERMVELFSKHCELVEENPSAGRMYLQPRKIKGTGEKVIDRAITKLVNSNIMKSTKSLRAGKSVDPIIFPDYEDVLGCIADCNKRNNLMLSKDKQQKLARKAFEVVGKELKLRRQRDYLDTFIDTEDDDPALKDPELMSKLQENFKKGSVKLDNVFKEYAKKQEELKDNDLNEISENSIESDNSDCVGDNEEIEEVQILDYIKNSDLVENETTEYIKCDNLNGKTSVNRKMCEMKTQENLNDFKNGTNKKSEELFENTQKKLKIQNSSDSHRSKGNGELNNKIIPEKSKESTDKNESHCKSDNFRMTTENKFIDPCEVSSVEVNSDTAENKNLFKEKLPLNGKNNTNSTNKIACGNNAPDNDAKVDKINSNKFEKVAGTLIESRSINTDDQYENDTPQLLRVRSFAKPPTTWNDDKLKLKTKNTSANTPSSTMLQDNSKSDTCFSIVKNSLEFGSKISSTNEKSSLERIPGANNKNIKSLKTPVILMHSVQHNKIPVIAEKNKQ